MVVPESVGITYNLTVEEGHTFYVGRFETWVHNTLIHCPTVSAEKAGGAGSRRWEGKTKKDGTPYARPGPKPKGEGAHNEKIDEIIQREKDKGNIHTGGGDKTEITIQNEGGIKPERRMDASFEDENGDRYHINFGRFNELGDPIIREREAESDVKQFAPPTDRNIKVEKYVPPQS